MPQAEQVNPEAITNEEQPQADQGQVQAIITGVQDGLFQLKEMLEKTPGIMPEDKTKLNNIISEYRGLITENLGSAPGEGSPESQPTMESQMPVHAGVNQVKQAF